MVVAQGSYIEHVEIFSIAAPRLFIHGHKGSFVGVSGNDGPSFLLSVPTTLRDLTASNSSGPVFSLGAGVVLERVIIDSSGTAIETGPMTVLRDVVVSSATDAISIGGGSSLTFERGVVRNAQRGIVVVNTGTFEVSNVVLHSIENLALDLELGTGTVSFTTVTDSGQPTGSGPKAIKCGIAGTIRSSIVWVPGGTRPAVAGCNVASSIVGPTALSGVPSSDPKFVSPATGDYHLMAGSPARDVVQAGPALDFEGDARPIGAGFDLGADEAP